MRVFLRSRFVLALTALVMLAVAVAVPLVSGSIGRSHAAAPAGALWATGHDADLHCYAGDPACHYLQVAVNFVTRGSTLPILALDHGNEIAAAISDAFGSSAPTVNTVDPRTSFASLPLVSSSGTPLYSAIIVASDTTCGGCDNNDDLGVTPDSDAINARAADIKTFFNAGGGILALAGAQNISVYYNFLPLTVSPTTVSPSDGSPGGFTLTSLGQSLGLTSSDVNCCETHNSFQLPTSSSSLQVAETDSAGNAETLISGSSGARISDITLSVTPTTSLYKVDMDVQLFSSNITCPAKLTLTVGPLTSTMNDVCNGTKAAPSDVHILLPVFNPTNPSQNLSPNSSTTASATILDQVGQNQKSVTVSIPPTPIWVGVGDSYSSGHHQLKNERHCIIGVFERNHCNVTENDPKFSWVGRAVTDLNKQLKVPTEWLMAVDVEARSGYTTSQILSGEVPNMETKLTAHHGSWNIVSVTGGANDIAFVDELAAFYKANLFNNLEPWSITNVKQCVDTQSIWNKLQQLSASIKGNLNRIVADAVLSDQNVRVVDVDYPYVMDKSNVCSPNRMVKQGKKTVLVHGSTSVVDGIDSLHNQLTGSRIVHIDLRTLFSTSPLGDIQLDALYGYPHPNATGQQAIADFAVKVVSSF